MTLDLSTVKVVDADTHLVEVADLFTSRAPASLRDRVPHVEVVDGRSWWVMEGTTLGNAYWGGVIAGDGTKVDTVEAYATWGWPEDLHAGSYDVDARLAYMDASGIWTQVVFPNNLGLGGNRFSEATTDRALLDACIEIYNDYGAEVQERSGNRLLPMAVMPVWDIEGCVREARRAHALGLRGVNMTTDPSDQGAPDLADRVWEPFFEVCEELELPLHFHIGNSATGMSFYEKYFWASHNENIQFAIGGTMLFIGNARSVVNIICSGMLERHPGLEIVSVESGAGWVPFVLEALRYEMQENAPADAAKLSLTPLEYFQRQMYATTWFEHADLPYLVSRLGADRVLWESDFPHPTCLYPDPLQHAAETMAALDSADAERILGGNAQRLYKL